VFGGARRLEEKVGEIVDRMSARGPRGFVAYDSDLMEKDGVRGALERLTVLLVGQGARVRWVFLPPDRPP
jgi:hypothetical protein